MFDLLVVLISLVLEIIYSGESEFGLVVLARMWRFVQQTKYTALILQSMQQTNKTGNADDKTGVGSHLRHLVSFAYLHVTDEHPMP